GGADGTSYGVHVLAVRYASDVPAVGRVAPEHVLAERDLGLAVDGDPVVVVEDDQLAETQMAGERRCLAAHALHEVAVRGDHVRAVVYDLEAGPVVTRGQVRLGEGHADGGRDALAERPRGRLYAHRMAVLRMPWCAAVPLSVALQLLHGQVVAREVEQRVLQHRAVPGGLDVAVAVRPPRLRRVVAHGVDVEDVAHGGRAHRHAGVTVAGCLRGVDRERAYGVDGPGRDGVPCGVRVGHAPSGTRQGVPRRGPGKDNRLSVRFSERWSGTAQRTGPPRGGR